MTLSWIALSPESPWSRLRPNAPVEHREQWRWVGLRTQLLSLLSLREAFGDRWERRISACISSAQSVQAGLKALGTGDGGSNNGMEKAGKKKEAKILQHSTPVPLPRALRHNSAAKQILFPTIRLQHFQMRLQKFVTRSGRSDGGWCNAVLMVWICEIGSSCNTEVWEHRVRMESSDLCSEIYPLWKSLGLHAELSDTFIH